MENLEQNRNQQPENQSQKKNEKWEFIDPNFSMKGFMLFAGIIFLILASTGTYYILKKTRNQIPEGIPCTLEAKICPDGSSVERTGPKCEFSPCPNIKSSPTESLELLQKNPSETTLTPIPSESTLANWKTYTNTKFNFSVKYPQNYSFNEMDEYSSGRGESNDSLIIFTNANSVSQIKHDVYSLEKSTLLLGITVSSLKKGQSLNDWFKIYSTTPNNLSSAINVQCPGCKFVGYQTLQPAVLAGIQGFSFIMPEKTTSNFIFPMEKHILIADENNVYDLFTNTNVDSKKDQIIINSILSTFKFTQ